MTRGRTAVEAHVERIWWGWGGERGDIVIVAVVGFGMRSISESVPSTTVAVPIVLL